MSGGGWEGGLTGRADLEDTPPQPVRPASTAGVRSSAREPVARKRAPSPPAFAGEGAKARGCRRSYNGDRLSPLSDRKSVVEGKRVSVRVDLGGRRSIKKKTKHS